MMKNIHLSHLGRYNVQDLSRSKVCDGQRYD